PHLRSAGFYRQCLMRGKPRIHEGRCARSMRCLVGADRWSALSFSHETHQRCTPLPGQRSGTTDAANKKPPGAVFDIACRWPEGLPPRTAATKKGATGTLLRHPTVLRI